MVFEKPVDLSKLLEQQVQNLKDMTYNLQIVFQAMAALESDSNMSTSQVKKIKLFFLRDKIIEIVTNITVDGKGVLSDANTEGTSKLD